MSHAPSGSDPDRRANPDQDAVSEPAAAPATGPGSSAAEPRPDGSAEPSESAPPAAEAADRQEDATTAPRKPLRPVDWDGSFTRTWASRDANAVTDRLADEFEDELAQQQADRLSRKYRDEANARADARQRVELDRLLEQPAGDDARPSLFDRLENFGRVWDDEDRGSPDAGSGDSAGPR